MKKLLTAVCAILALSLALAGCASRSEDASKIVIGATAVPHAEILEFVRADLSAAGIELEIREFSDFALVNPALADGQLDANYFQHVPYLDNYIANTGRDIAVVGKVHIEPMGVYSQRIDDLADLPDGAVVGIPNDAVNGGRALLLLESLGLITLRDGVGLRAIPGDITHNPKNLNITEIEAAMLPRLLGETDISVINTNFALSVGLNPMDDAVAMEGVDSPYANIVAVRGEDADCENIKKLLEVLQTEKVRDFILERYRGAVVPVF
ncbi:MAG: MetQ/NlpA family ABC transporter substrate-binding protein [Defluviitaleaceae bacterium]|nr:MetQ/NlpA family ABC transporter substrate-binding protein [Defluviitaleaceae bacterium]MCL2836609.1 MetQ/NlpA family ABC transporter substrate-binding protein [Defluviitaleaceae bacterium]